VLKALITDVDGTISGPDRELCLEAVQVIRSLVLSGVPVILASGNTACFMDALCKMIGSEGTFIGENGGIFRIGYKGEIFIRGDRSATKRCLSVITNVLKKEGLDLELFSHNYRFSDIAFARTVPIEHIKRLISDDSVAVVDTGYAIHIHSKGVSKGAAMVEIAKITGLAASDFLAIGDGINDIEMFRVAGKGAALKNAHKELKKVSDYVSQNMYGEGFIECVRLFLPHLLANDRSTTI